MELTVVVMIIAILGSIAATRMARVTEDAGDHAQAATVVELQKAIDRYHGEHGEYPRAVDLAVQLTQYTDPKGNVAAARSAAFRFGPYLKAAPPIHPGPNGVALLWKETLSSAKWVYDEATGDVRMK